MNTSCITSSFPRCVWRSNRPYKANVDHRKKLEIVLDRVSVQCLQALADKWGITPETAFEKIFRKILAEKSI